MSTNSNNFEIERLTKEKINIENQFVIFKLKFAENNDKILNLEDTVELYENKIRILSSTVKTKDDIIQKLVKDIDQYKNFKNNKKSNPNDTLVKSTKINKNLLAKTEQSFMGISTKSPSQVIKTNNIENDNIYFGSRSEYRTYNTSLPVSPEKNINKFNLEENTYNSNITERNRNSLNDRKTTEYNNGNNSDSSESYRVPTHKGNKVNNSFVSIIKNIFGSNKK